MKLFTAFLMIISFSLSLSAGENWLKASQLTFAAAQVADLTTSVRMNGGPYCEQNPLFRSDNCQFATGRGIVLKSAMVGGVLLFDMLWMRKHPNHRKALTVLNFALSAPVAEVAVHNAILVK